GEYMITPDGHSSSPVYCDMTTQGGGWTVFQRRADGTTDFHRGWNQYKTGFGNLSDEFWLGNDLIHLLTKQPSTLHVEIEDWNGVKKIADFGRFQVEGETTGFRLTVSDFSKASTAGNSLAVHNRMKFTTHDRDNDMLRGHNCASLLSGGWWFTDCHFSNLNGEYVGDIVNEKGVVWYQFEQSFKSFRLTQMMTRPIV
ncbi:predicted protein, partial [Nematostella vectensis]